jgi:ParB family protein of integrating conjugative element (PFGI_1 class)
MADSKSRTKPAIPFAADADLSRLAKKMSPKDVRALARAPVSLSASLNIPNPPNAAAGITPNSMLDGTKHEIPLAKLRPYDRNPRKSSNAAFDEIKASLKATGRDSLELWVTQRPGQDWYMPYRGGNTRLTAVQELFQAGDTRWERLIVTYKVWVSEADTLAQHLIENNNRADMTFWDKACAYLVDMRAEIEQEVGGEVSLRRLEDELSKRGVGIKKSLLSLFQFAVARLAKIGPYLSATQVIQLQPAINLLARLAEKFSLDDAGFQTVLDTVRIPHQPGH